ncbi:hypothetical protein MicloDRAFT_00069580 [Microvirga lotononidis]|uniref:Uncharacterized protein n=1 Tax=Microvirga lotononidis TaxID=864069 RepID=I4YKE7_9HYPH|nr:hypothetical protein MicloDRAFT_00069580 [Microvirga lotononidis]
MYGAERQLAAVSGDGPYVDDRSAGSITAIIAAVLFFIH